MRRKLFKQRKESMIYIHYMVILLEKYSHGLLSLQELFLVILVDAVKKLRLLPMKLN